MNQATALKALDEAMVDEIKNEVSVLVRGFESNEDGALDRFRNGLKIHLVAYAAAEQAIKDTIT